MKRVTSHFPVVAACIALSTPVSVLAQAQAPSPTVESICDDGKLSMADKAACRGKMQLASSVAEKDQIRLEFETKIKTGVDVDPPPTLANPPATKPDAPR